MKPIPGLTGYFATETGEVVSVRSGKPRVLQSQIYGGYHRITVSVRVNGVKERHRFEVHRLVLKAYAGLPCQDGQEARHLNGLSTDNRPSNLAWGTRQQNMDDAVRHGTIGPGMKARRRKLSDSQVIEIIRRSNAGEHKVHIAAEFGIHPDYIPKLLSGKAWACLGVGAI